MAVSGSQRTSPSACARPLSRAASPGGTSSCGSRRPNDEPSGPGLRGVQAQVRAAAEPAILQLPAGERPVRRRQRQERQRPTVRLPVVPAEGERNHASPAKTTPLAIRTRAQARRWRYSHGEMMSRMPDRGGDAHRARRPFGALLLSGPCIGLPPVSCGASTRSLITSDHFDRRIVKAPGETIASAGGRRPGRTIAPATQGASASTRAGRQLGQASDRPGGTRFFVRTCISAPMETSAFSQEGASDEPLVGHAIAQVRSKRNGRRSFVHGAGQLRERLAPRWSRRARCGTIGQHGAVHTCVDGARQRRRKGRQARALSGSIG